MKFPFWLKAVLLSIPAVLLMVFLVLLAVGWYVKGQVLESGGPLRPLMAGYDVRHYDLDLAVDPSKKSIRGTNRVTVAALAVLDEFEIHLDDRLHVRSVDVDGAPAEFDHDDGLILVDLPEPWPAGSRHVVGISYDGRPKTAIRPPWIDGFVWSETPAGEPWVGVTGEGDGGDNWWPCKDHPSDEPDEGMEIALTVPETLVGLSNGRPMGEVANGDGTVTSRWRVGFPINNYCVTVNIGPYEPIEIAYRGTDGNLDERLVFWAIPEAVGDAERMWEQMPEILAVLGRRFGEYPFFKDKFWVAHAPYLGMEHQTIVAYGDAFRDNDFGFDEMLLHEVAHEWWGNKITALDWGDLWIHEGFASYAEALFVLDTKGEESYLDYMQYLRARMMNQAPVVKGTDLTASEAYSPDIYGKGAWVLHMLRLLAGAQNFDEIVWRFAAGDEPTACRFATTEDFTDLVEEVTSLDLGWFWQRYLFTAELPSWRLNRILDGGEERIQLEWNDPAFEMPLPVQIGDHRRLVAMPGGRAEFRVDAGTAVEVDPGREVLTAEPAR
jgi:aminopeptidase N